MTLEQANAHLAAWLAADLALTRQQSYQMNGVTLTRADAATVTEKIRFWEGRVAQISSAASGRSRVRYVV